MSSDPIEVLRRIVELARRHEGHDPQLREALASLSAPKPSGEWVLVPREPTEAMVANMAASLDYPSTRMGGPSPLMLRNVERAYGAMLAAAPKPESAEASEERCRACGLPPIAAGKPPLETCACVRLTFTEPQQASAPVGATLTNPWTGEPRDYRDVNSDPEGVLCVEPGAPLKAAPSAPVGVEGIAKLIADHIGHGMSEKCESLAERIVSALAQQPAAVDGERWGGWATQYPGKIPKLYGAEEIARLNWHPAEGQDLIRVVEVDRVSAADWRAGQQQGGES